MTSSLNIRMRGYGICLLAAIIGCFIIVAKGESDIPDWVLKFGYVWGNEDTNKIREGIRAHGEPESLIIKVDVLLGKTNGGLKYLAPPAIKFSKVELRDLNGSLIGPLVGKQVDGDLPQRMAIKDWPRDPIIGTKYKGRDGGLRGWLGGQPAKLSEFIIQSVYHIEKEGDYTLATCSVIYGFLPDYKAVTSLPVKDQFVTRVDLPCVTVKIHLKPPVQAK